MSAATVQTPKQTTSAPVAISSQLQLFVDRELIDTLEDVELRLQTPERQRLPASPLKGAYITVIKDGDLYRAYFRGQYQGYDGPTNFSGHPGEVTCYAESRDGQEWSYPNLGICEVNGTRENNIIIAGQKPFMHNFSPFLDARPGVDPSERFKALAGHPGHQRTVKADGLHAFASADGLHWKKISEEPVVPFDMSWSHAFDSQNVSFWSEAEQLYICYFRTWAPYRDASGASSQALSSSVSENSEAGASDTLRTIGRTTSADFKTWSKPTIMNPNLPGEHLYTSQTHPYFRAPHIYIALPSRYVAGRLGEKKADAMSGSTDILLMSSRAGSTTFDRLFTEAFIRPGLDPKRWADRANYVALNVVPTGPAEMSIYHGSGHRYTLRTDGFIAVHAGAEKGELLTKALTFTGKELLLNFSTAAAGSLQVEIQGADGSPIEGFRLEDCSPMVGDEIERAVRWTGDPDLNVLSGQPVRLRFVMREADLFSFRFR